MSTRDEGARLLDTLVEPYLAREDVTEGRMFASDGFFVRGKLFAFVATEGRLIVKLPRARRDALVASGEAEAVVMGHRTMREWVAAPLTPSCREHWAALVAEAFAYLDEITP